MTDVKVEQVDRDAAASCVSSKKAKREIIDGVWDESSTVQAFARHRQAAEKAQQERDAGIAYRVCAETRHVTLGDKVATAIRSQGHE